MTRRERDHMPPETPREREYREAAEHLAYCKIEVDHALRGHEMALARMHAADVARTRERVIAQVAAKNKEKP